MKVASVDATQDREARHVCQQCGRHVENVFQDETCKPCLLKNFGRHRTMIDKFRNMRPPASSFKTMLDAEVAKNAQTSLSGP